MTRGFDEVFHLVRLSVNKIDYMWRPNIDVLKRPTRFRYRRIRRDLIRKSSTSRHRGGPHEQKDRRRVPVNGFLQNRRCCQAVCFPGKY